MQRLFPLLVTVFIISLCARSGASTSGADDTVPGDRGIRFTENRGQIADTRGAVRNDIRFVAEGAGARLYFSDRGVSYVFADSDPATAATEPAQDGFAKTAPRETRMHRMDMELVGSNPFPRIRFEDELPGYSNYYLAHCPDGITHVKSYATVVYEDVYDNIDLVFMSREGRLKYEYRVRPGGRPADIAMRYSGASRLALLPGGTMEVHSPLGYIEEAQPYTYEDNGREVRSSYRLRDDVLTFDIGRYSATHTLVIDPWATYYGSSESDGFADLDIDANGNIYVTGDTQSTHYPIVNGMQSASTGEPDLVIGKFSSTGDVAWMTYFGGSDWEGFGRIAVGANGQCITVGSTSSGDLPVQNAVQPVPAGSQLEDLCIISLNAAGIRSWSTYYGGAGYERSPEVALDANGNAVITGATSDPGIPVTANAYQPVMGSDRDGFIVKLSPAGQTLWATFAGGNGIDGGDGIVVDAFDDIVLLLQGESTNLPTSASAFQTSSGGLADLWLAKFSANGSLQWSSYYGGSGNERADLGITPSNDILMCGITSSSNLPLPTQPAPFQGSLSGDSDFFVVQMSSNGTALNWGTYINCSGSSPQYGEGNNAPAIASDSNGDVLFAGITANSAIPLLNAHQSFNAGQKNALLGKIHGSTGMPEWVTFYGGSPGEWSMSMGLGADGEGNVFMSGATYSTNLPIDNAYQPYFAGRTDAFLASFTSSGVGPPLRYATISVSPEQTIVNQEYHTIYLGIGSQSLTLTAGSTSGAAVSSYQWSTNEPTQSIVVSPTTPTTYSVTVTDANNVVSTASVRIHVVDVRCGPNLSEVVYCVNGVTKCEDEKKVLRTLSRDSEARLGACTSLPQNQPPDAVASASPTSGAVPLTVDFSSAGSSDPDGSIVSYEWDFGDGNMSTLENPQHIYSSAGTYTAQLTVTDNATATASDNVTITVSGGTSSGTTVIASQAVTRVCVQTKADRWEGRDVVVVQDDQGAPVPGAIVSASYSGPNTGTTSGSTDGSGEVTLATAAQKSPSASWCFTVTDVRAAGYTFDAANSVMTACESSPKSSVTIPGTPRLTVHPNPMANQAHVRFSLPEAGSVMLILYDQLGREVATLAEGMYPAGSHTVRYPAAKHARGTYFCRLYYGEDTETVRIIMR